MVYMYYIAQACRTDKVMQNILQYAMWKEQKIIVIEYFFLNFLLTS